MKVSLLLNSCLTIVLLLTTISCTKTIVNSTKLQSDSLVGDWVLKYSDSADTRLYYPQDSSFSGPHNSGGYSTWASHLSLLKNDSAYWVSCAVDGVPQALSLGIYSVSFDSANNPKISFDFLIGTWGTGIYSTFEYTFKSNDTLILKNLSAYPITYSYARK